MWYFLTYLNRIPRGYIALFYTCLGTRPKQIALSKSYICAYICALVIFSATTSSIEPVDATSLALFNTSVAASS